MSQVGVLGTLLKVKSLLRQMNLELYRIFTTHKALCCLNICILKRRQVGQSLAIVLVPNQPEKGVEIILVGTVCS